MAFLNKRAIYTCKRIRGIAPRVASPRIHRRTLGISLLGFLAGACLLLSVLTDTHAQIDQFKEFQVKSVFIYHLTNFVSWPDKAFDGMQAPLRIGVLGDNRFGTFLSKTVQGEEVKGRHIVVDRIKKVKDLDPSTYHILFISSSLKKQLPGILQATQNWSVLTVGDTKGFANLGGIVNFIRKGKRVHVEINVNSAKRVGLTISSKLLKLAKIVNGQQTMED